MRFALSQTRVTAKPTRLGLSESKPDCFGQRSRLHIVHLQFPPLVVGSAFGRSFFRIMQSASECGLAAMPDDGNTSIASAALWMVPHSHPILQIPHCPPPSLWRAFFRARRAMCIDAVHIAGRFLIRPTQAKARFSPPPRLCGRVDRWRCRFCQRFFSSVVGWCR